MPLKFCGSCIAFAMQFAIIFEYSVSACYGPLSFPKVYFLFTEYQISSENVNIEFWIRKKNKMDLLQSEARIWIWLRYLGPLDLRTFGPLPFSTTSSYFLLPPSISSSNFFVPPPTLSYLLLSLPLLCQITSDLCYSSQKSFLSGGWWCWVTFQLLLQAPGPGLWEFWNRPWDLKFLEFIWRPRPELDNITSQNFYQLYLLFEEH